MQKSEFIEHVAKKANVTKTEADKVVRASLDVIKETLAGGDKVTLVGFGSFEVRQRGERTVTSIRSKEKVTVAATKLPAFSAGSELKAAVSGKAAAKSDAPAKAAPAKKAAAKK
jgi:DNA-binding protein HU-beta